MSVLTRRRSTDAHRESWSIYYDDVRVGTIGKRAGLPVEVDQWGWSLGFYPGLEPGQPRSGSSQTFDQARTDFEAAWADLLQRSRLVRLTKTAATASTEPKFGPSTPAAKDCRAR